MNSHIEIRDMLKERDIKVTPQRIAVYKALYALGHASVEEVVAEVAKKSANITTATVYNVLDCFADKGIITRLHTPKGKMYYDISTYEHSHIIDTNGSIIDYDNQELIDIIKNYLQKNPIKDVEVEKISLQFMAKDSIN